MPKLGAWTEVSIGVVSRRKSVMLSSEAPQAGKTTTLSALVDFLPPQTVVP